MAGKQCLCLKMYLKSLALDLVCFLLHDFWHNALRVSKTYLTMCSFSSRIRGHISTKLWLIDTKLGK